MVYSFWDYQVLPFGFLSAVGAVQLVDQHWNGNIAFLPLTAPSRFGVRIVRLGSYRQPNTGSIGVHCGGVDRAHPPGANKALLIDGRNLSMSTRFDIKSSDDLLLEKATRVAKDFAQQFVGDKVIGIVFLGAIARGYFDPSADIDIAILKKQASEIPLPNKFLKAEGLEVHCWLSDYEDELTQPWDMAKRWTYSQGSIYYDPQEKISRLLAEKVPLKAEEKKWLLMSGLALSEWYINRLTHTWVERGSLVSAHQMFSQGLNYFLEMLFALNNQLVADVKWRYYCAERLKRLPSEFRERIKATMMLNAISMEELERRRAAFMEMWREMVPVVEKEVQLSYDEISQLV
jgi:hypothetical protein